MSYHAGSSLCISADSARVEEFVAMFAASRGWGTGAAVQAGLDAMNDRELSTMVRTFFKSLVDGSTSSLAKGGIRDGCWNRDIEVAWFGAWGDGTDQTAAIEAAVAYAQSLSVGVDEYKGLHGRGVTPRLRFRAGGRYVVTRRISCVRLSLVGNQTYLRSDNPNEEILQIDGALGTLEGFVFGGGKHHIRIVGPNVDGMRTTIRDCAFTRTIGGAASIALDTSVHNPERAGFSMLLDVQGFKSDGAPLISGGADGINVKDGWVSWNGALGPWLDVIGNLDVQSVLGVPYNQNPESPWIRLQGLLAARNFRFGGEGGGAPILHWRHSPGYQARVSLQDCPVYCAMWPWAKFSGAVPNLSIASTGFVSSIPAVIDDAAEAWLYTNDARGLVIENRSQFPAGPIPFAREDGSRVEVLSLRQSKSDVDISTEPALDNLLAGVLSVSLNNVVHDGVVPCLDGDADAWRTTADAANGSWSIAGAMDALPEGAYTFSFYVSSSLPVAAYIEYGGAMVGRATEMWRTNGAFARMACTFWHSPTRVANGTLALGFYGHKTGTVVAHGMHMLNTGTRAAIYAAPVLQSLTRGEK